MWAASKIHREVEHDGAECEGVVALLLAETFTSSGVPFNYSIFSYD
jgi:hypothetical protein